MDANGMMNCLPKVAVIHHAPFRIRHWNEAAVAQPVERVLGKDEVKGPIPFSSSLVGQRKTGVVYRGGGERQEPRPERGRGRYFASPRVARDFLRPGSFV